MRRSLPTWRSVFFFFFAEVDTLVLHVIIIAIAAAKPTFFFSDRSVFPKWTWRKKSVALVYQTFADFESSPSDRWRYARIVDLFYQNQSRACDDICKKKKLLSRVWPIWHRKTVECWAISTKHDEIKKGVTEAILAPRIIDRKSKNDCLYRLLAVHCFLHFFNVLEKITLNTLYRIRQHSFCTIILLHRLINILMHLLPYYLFLQWSKAQSLK